MSCLLLFCLEPKFLDLKEIEPTSHSTVRMGIFIKEGIPKETGQKIVKLIKGLEIKVQPTIQDDQVRITGKKIDLFEESVLHCESHGIRDKGTVVTHQYLVLG